MRTAFSLILFLGLMGYSYGATPEVFPTGNPDFSVKAVDYETSGSSMVIELSIQTEDSKIILRQHESKAPVKYTAKGRFLQVSTQMTDFEILIPSAKDKDSPNGYRVRLLSQDPVNCLPEAQAVLPQAASRIGWLTIPPDALVSLKLPKGVSLLAQPIISDSNDFSFANVTRGLGKGATIDLLIRSVALASVDEANMVSLDLLTDQGTYRFWVGVGITPFRDFQIQGGESDGDLKPGVQEIPSTRYSPVTLDWSQGQELAIPSANHGILDLQLPPEVSVKNPPEGLENCVVFTSKDAKGLTHVFIKVIRNVDQSLKVETNAGSLDLKISQAGSSDREYLLKSGAGLK